MKKLLLALIVCGALPSVAHAWFRLGNGAQPVTQNSGNKAEGISVTVTDSAATLVYTGADKHREIFLQNTSETYNVFCGTFSAVTASSGVKRWILPPFPTGFTTNGTYSIYCIAETGGSAEIVGSIESDSRD